MTLDNFGVYCDIETTQTYRDLYNQQCECKECRNFRRNFSLYYPKTVKILARFGIDIMYPLEIMDLGVDEYRDKREYSVYYSVKGQLPVKKIESKDSGVSITLRDWTIADESYSNTGMVAPYFIIEVSNVFLPY